MTTRVLSIAAMSGSLPRGREPVLRAEDAAVRAAQGGDATAFRQVYEAHVGRIYALCVRLTADPPWAEELTQDVFVRAWERLASFRGESAFGTWLFTLARNEVLMAFRTSRRRELRVSSRETPPDLPSPRRSSPDEAIDLERAIALLPEGCRLVFVLHDVEGLTHEEIAGITGTAVGTSKAHLFRARRLLREALAP